MTGRPPTPAQLGADPLLGSLVLLDLAAGVAANTLRAYYVDIQGDFCPDETHEVATARILARECDVLRNILDSYRRGVLARLDRQNDGWTF